MKHIGVATGAVLLVAVLAIAAIFFLRPPLAHSQSAGSSITGYFWSSTIGWIDLNCSNSGLCSGSENNWGLSIDTSGNITGYAWSDNIGWISAVPSDLVGCPSGPCTATIGGSGALSGWMRALAGNTSQSGNWDGFISLSGITESGGNFSGYGWGATNVGWVDSEDAHTTYDTCAPSTVWGCSDTETIVSTTTSSSCAQTISHTSCTPPDFCSAGSSQCAVPTIICNSPDGCNGDLQAIPNIVQPSGTTTISWSVSDAQSCSVWGSNGDGTTTMTTQDQNSPGWWNTETGSKISSPITSEVTYTLSCTGYPDATPPSILESVQVDTTPIYKEI